MVHRIAIIAALILIPWADASYNPKEVTSSSIGYRSESIYVDSSCNIQVQVGSWVTSSSRPTAGECDLTIASGIFSVTPKCVCASLDGGSTPYPCIGGASSTTAAQFVTSISGVGPSDRGKVINCVGKR